MYSLELLMGCNGRVLARLVDREQFRIKSSMQFSAYAPGFVFLPEDWPDRRTVGECLEKFGVASKDVSGVTVVLPWKCCFDFPIEIGSPGPITAKDVAKALNREYNSVAKDSAMAFDWMVQDDGGENSRAQSAYATLIAKPVIRRFNDTLGRAISGNVTVLSHSWAMLALCPKSGKFVAISPDALLVKFLIFDEGHLTSVGHIELAGEKSVVEHISRLPLSPRDTVAVFPPHMDSDGLVWLSHTMKRMGFEVLETNSRPLRDWKNTCSGSVQSKMFPSLLAGLVLLAQVAGAQLWRGDMYQRISLADSEAKVHALRAQELVSQIKAQQSKQEGAVTAATIEQHWPAIYSQLSQASAKVDVKSVRLLPHSGSEGGSRSLGIAASGRVEDVLSFAERLNTGAGISGVTRLGGEGDLYGFEVVSDWRL